MASRSLTGGPNAEARTSQIPMKGMSISRIMEIITEHGTQLRRLRTEHDVLKSEHQALVAEGQALRRCLDGAGVVASDRFEDELRSCSAANAASRASLAAGTGGTGSASVVESITDASEVSGCTPSLASSLSASSSSRASLGSLQRRAAHGVKEPAGDTPGAGHASSSSSYAPPSRGSRGAAGGGGASAANSSRRSSSGGAASGAASGGVGGGVSKKGPPPCPDRDRTPTRPRRSGSSEASESRIPAPPLSSRGRREVEAAAPIGTSRSRSASGSPARRGLTASGKIQAQPAKDLYELAQPILQPSGTAEQQSAALSAVAQALRSGAAPNKWSGPGSPLRCAVQAHKLELARVLLQAKTDPNESDQKGVSVLHTAAFDGQTDLCKVLLDFKADPNQADRHGQTPLFFAPVRAVCEALYLKKADVNIMNQKGQSSLHLAGRAGLSEVLVWLAAKVAKPVLELRDTHGATAAYYARHAGVQPDVLIRTKLVSFEPPPPLAGRSGLVDTGAKGPGSFGGAGASLDARQRRSSKSSRSGDADGDAEPHWLVAGPLGGLDGGRLPPLPEDHGSVDDDQDEEREAVSGRLREESRQLWQHDRQAEVEAKKLFADEVAPAGDKEVEDGKVCAEQAEEMPGSSSSSRLRQHASLSEEQHTRRPSTESVGSSCSVHSGEPSHMGNAGPHDKDDAYVGSSRSSTSTATVSGGSSTSGGSAEAPFSTKTTFELPAEMRALSGAADFANDLPAGLGAKLSRLAAAGFGPAMNGSSPQTSHSTSPVRADALADCPQTKRFGAAGQANTEDAPEDTQDVEGATCDRPQSPLPRELGSSGPPSPQEVGAEEEEEQEDAEMASTPVDAAAVALANPLLADPEPEASVHAAARGGTLGSSVVPAVSTAAPIASGGDRPTDSAAASVASTSPTTDADGGRLGNSDVVSAPRAAPKCLPVAPVAVSSSAPTSGADLMVWDEDEDDGDVLLVEGDEEEDCDSNEVDHRLKDSGKAGLSDADDGALREEEDTDGADEEGIGSATSGNSACDDGSRASNARELRMAQRRSRRASVGQAYVYRRGGPGDDDEDAEAPVEV